MFLPRHFEILSTYGVVGRLRFAGWVATGLFAALMCGAQQLQAPFGYSLDGQPVTSLVSPDTKAIVLFFTATDCPISNRYIPAIQRLENKYAPQHVMFWYVYPNAGETEAGVRQHEVDYGTEQHVLLDPRHRLVDLARAKVTPEAAVLVPGLSADSLRVLYRGRIDNRYLQIGLQRPSATQFDLERAIKDVLEQRAVEPPDGPPVGCGIIGQR